MITHMMMHGVLALALIPLVRVTDAFSAISPLTLPEDVVQRQLDAFQKSDVKAAFEFTSPENKIICGPTWENLNEILSSEPAFAPIIGHERATVLMTVADDEWGMCCLVRLVPSPSSPMKQACLEYWWELSKRQEGDAMEGCWMIDAIMPNFEDLSISMVFEEDDDFYDVIDLYDSDDD